MKGQWFIFTLVSLILAGCTNANSNSNERLVTIDYKRLVTPVNEDLALPPSMRDLIATSPHTVNNPYLLQLERLSDYRAYIDRNIAALEVKLDKDKKERNKARDSLSDTTFNCSLPLMQQIDLGDRPRASVAIAGLTEQDIAMAAIEYAEKLKAFNEASLTKISEAAMLYAEICK